MGLLASHIAVFTRVPVCWNTSSTPTSGTSPLTSLPLIAFPNALSPPSLLPRDHPLHYFIVQNSILTTQANPTTTSSALPPVPFSDQSQPTTSSTVLTSMSMAISAVSSSESSPASSLSTPGTSAASSSTSSSHAATTSDLSGTSNLTTPTLTSFALSITSLSPTTSSSPTTTLSTTTPSPHTTTSSLALPSTSTSSIYVTSSTPSSLAPQASLTSIDIQVTTVLASTTVFITSTNSVGEVVTSEPPVVTEVITTTGSDGVATTVTQAVVNPTLAQDNNATVTSSFFDNTGAVVGVFVVVGLASASIMLWILFAIRRRQRMRQIQDDALEAVVAAAGLNRAPLDDDNENGSPESPQTHGRFLSEMGQRGSLLGYGSRRLNSLLTSTRSSEPYDDVLRSSSLTDCHSGDRSEGYAPAKISPTQKFERSVGCNDYGSSRERKSSYGHTPTYSAGSFEPLLANYGQTTGMSERDSSIPPTPLPRNFQHLVDASPRGSTSNFPHHPLSDESLEDRSETRVKRQNSFDSAGSVPPQNDGDRPVLMVCNVSDFPSEHSL